MSKIKVNEQRAVDEFQELTAIDASSFGERQMADRLIVKLKELGFEVEEDNAGEHFGGNAGNLYAYLPGDLPGDPVLLSGHMDTVEPSKGKKGIIGEDGVIRSAGKAVLGADDVAGLVEILEGIRSVKEAGVPHRDIEILFAIAEELYIKGSSAVRTVSPWQLAWENGCYYLIAYQDEKAPPVRHYRVDRMAGVLVLDEPRRGKEFFRTFDLPAYLRKHFNMFGGTEYRVTLRCTADLEPVMRERFGREPVFCPEDAEHFHFDVPICVSQQFFGWVCGFGGKVEVTAPAAVRTQLHEMLQSLAEQHG